MAEENLPGRVLQRFCLLRCAERAPLSKNLYEKGVSTSPHCQRWGSSLISCVEREHLKEEPVGNGKKKRDPMTSILGELSYAPVINDHKISGTHLNKVLARAHPKAARWSSSSPSRGRKPRIFVLGLCGSSHNFQISRWLLDCWGSGRESWRSLPQPGSDIHLCSQSIVQR